MLAADATAFFGVSATAVASRLRARPRRRVGGPPRFRLPSSPLRFGSRATSLVVSQGLRKRLCRPCLPPRLRRCASSCRASSRGRCLSGCFRTPSFRLCAARLRHPRGSPPSPPFSPSSSLAGGGSSAKPSRPYALPPARAYAVSARRVSAVCFKPPLRPSKSLEGDGFLVNEAKVMREAEKPYLSYFASSIRNTRQAS